MFSLLVLLFLLPFSTPYEADGYGYLELRLKSAFKLNVTVEVVEGIYFPVHKKTYTMRLMPGMIGTLTNIPVRFHRPGVVLISTGPIEKFNLLFETIRLERWNTQRMTRRPSKIHLPFTGFTLDIKCERYWHGVGCNKFCNENFASLINARCNDEGNIGCPIGFRGYCREPLLNTHPECQCKNNGTCVNSFRTTASPETFSCECANGFEGKKCEKIAFNYLVPMEVKMHGTNHKWSMLKQFFNNSLVDNELL